MPSKFSNWVTKITAVFKKEIKSEFRTRYALNSILMFAVVTLTTLSFTVGQFALTNPVKSALLWVILFFSAMSGLAQVFIKEEERRTASILKLSALPNVIFLGKFFFNLVLLFMLEIVTIPLFLILLSLQVESWLLLLVILLLGSLGLTSATTIIGAIVSKTNVKGTLLTVLSFPILLPLLVISIQGTKLALDGSHLAGAGSEIIFLLSYTIVMLTASILFFETVWME
ncbi:MAG: hypothetical protein A2145_02320 [candidate division Zixibacteria bacterium RBG_16_40_9]|nr:MAG: hypothetical protein A2145_02320 [candidate division Zixibacteria bacterium RBG_16_40_9]